MQRSINVYASILGKYLGIYFMYIVILCHALSLSSALLSGSFVVATALAAASPANMSGQKGATPLTYFIFCLPTRLLPTC